MVAHPDLREGLRQRFHQLVVTVLGHHDSGQRRTDLTGQHALGLGQPLRGHPEIDVIEDDGGRLSPELEGATGDPLAAQ